eukprot:TRINITY_DN22491_c0_g1_i1.p1 TRINITY_DN22491_c0_g1~~TRINITY_DN22491_c0_g1_i1.p1  ORF type:complete len:1616 (+),score=405.13 TRINITY_DN22491_c0_g1_i1:285-4850(+)
MQGTHERGAKWFGVSPEESYTYFGQVTGYAARRLHAAEEWLSSAGSYLGMAAQGVRSVDGTVRAHHDWEGFQLAMERRWAQRNPLYAKWQRHTQALSVGEDHFKQVLQCAERRGDADAAAKAQEELRRLADEKGNRRKWLRKEHEQAKWEEHCHLQGLDKPYPPVDKLWAAGLEDPPEAQFVQGDLQAELERGLQRRALALNPLWKRWEDGGNAGDPPLRWRQHQWETDPSVREECRRLGLQCEPPCDPSGPLWREFAIMRPDLSGDPPRYWLLQEWRANRTVRERCRALYTELPRNAFDSFDSFAASAPEALRPGGVLAVDWSLPQGFDGCGRAATQEPPGDWLRAEWECDLTLHERSERAGFTEGPPAQQWVLPGGAEGAWRGPLTWVQGTVAEAGPAVQQVTVAFPVGDQILAEVKQAVGGGDLLRTVERCFEGYHNAVASGEIRKLSPEKQVEWHNRVGAWADAYSGVLGRLRQGMVSYRRGLREAELRLERLGRHPTGASAADVGAAVATVFTVPGAALRGLAEGQPLGRHHNCVALRDGRAPGAAELRVRYDRWDSVAETWRDTAAAADATQEHLASVGRSGTNDAVSGSQSLWGKVQADLQRRGAAASLAVKAKDWTGVRSEAADLGRCVVERQIPVLPGDVRQRVHAEVTMMGSRRVRWEVHVCAEEHISWVDAVTEEVQHHSVRSSWLQLDKQDSDALERALQENPAEEHCFLCLHGCPAAVLRAFPYSSGNYASPDGPMAPEKPASTIAAEFREKMEALAEVERTFQLKVGEKPADSGMRVRFVDAEGDDICFLPHEHQGAAYYRMNGAERPFFTLCRLEDPRGRGPGEVYWSLRCESAHEFRRVPLPPAKDAQGYDATVVSRLRRLLDHAGVVHDFDEHSCGLLGRRVRVGTRQCLGEVCAGSGGPDARQLARAGDTGRVVSESLEEGVGAVEVLFAQGGEVVDFPLAAVELAEEEAAGAPETMLSRLMGAAKLRHAVIVDFLRMFLTDPSTGAQHRLRRSGRGVPLPSSHADTQGRVLGERPRKALRLVRRRGDAARSKHAEAQRRRMLELERKAADAAKRLAADYVLRSAGMTGVLGVVRDAAAERVVEAAEAASELARQMAASAVAPRGAVAAALAIPAGLRLQAGRGALRRWCVLRLRLHAAITAARLELRRRVSVVLPSADAEEAAAGSVSAGAETASIATLDAAAEKGRAAQQLRLSAPPDWRDYNPFLHRLPPGPRSAAARPVELCPAAEEAAAASLRRMSTASSLASLGASSEPRSEDTVVQADMLFLPEEAPWAPRSPPTEAAVRLRDHARQVQWPTQVPSQGSFNPFRQRLPLPEEDQRRRRLAVLPAAFAAAGAGALAAVGVAALAPEPPPELPPLDAHGVLPAPQPTEAAGVTHGSVPQAEVSPCTREAVQPSAVPRAAAGRGATAPPPAEERAAVSPDTCDHRQSLGGAPPAPPPTPLLAPEELPAPPPPRDADSDAAAPVQQQQRSQPRRHHRAAAAARPALGHISMTPLMGYSRQ